MVFCKLWVNAIQVFGKSSSNSKTLVVLDLLVKFMGNTLECVQEHWHKISLPASVGTGKKNPAIPLDFRVSVPSPSLYVCSEVRQRCWHLLFLFFYFIPFLQRHFPILLWQMVGWCSDLAGYQLLCKYWWVLSRLALARSNVILSCFVLPLRCFSMQKSTASFVEYDIKYAGFETQADFFLWTEGLRSKQLMTALQLFLLLRDGVFLFFHLEQKGVIIS